MENRRVEIDLSIYETRLKNEYPFLQDTQIKEFISYWNDFLQDYYFLFMEENDF